MTKTTAFISLGSNLGRREENVRKAAELIGATVGPVVRQSSVYYSPPWGFSSPNEFVNIVIEVSTSLSPHELLNVTQAIEHKMGRGEKSSRGVYHDRIIDIDILLYGDEHIDEPDLKIPHPLMYAREFVMKPLREIMNQPAT